jgi:hypothetical protein
LRWSENFTVDAVFNDIEAVNTALMEVMPTLSKLVDRFMKVMPVRKLGRVIIVSLKAGGMIDPHFDDGEYADHYNRFHIPLSSKAGNVFYAKTMQGYGEWATMKPGELWWFDNKKTHWVENHSEEPRIHLIFDAVVDGFEREYDIQKRAAK